MNDDIERYNLVNESNAKHPNYDLSDRVTSIIVYLTYLDELIIVGEIDNNYIYWMSVTKLNDTEINEKIFNRIATGNYTYVSNEHNVVSYNQWDYSVFRNTVIIKFQRETGKYAWRTPFKHYYGSSDIHNHGKYFAKDIISYRNKLHKQCGYREAEGNYKVILQKYKSLISNIDYDNYYSDVEPIYDLLLNESYLRLSEDENLRNLYNECCSMCSQKYNEWMTANR